MVLLLVFSLQLGRVAAQHALHIIVTVPANTDEVYVAGPFNNWEPGHENYKLTTIDAHHKQITLYNLKPGTVQFKFTQGTWQTAECQATGISSDNHSITVKSDTTVRLVIAAWSNAYFDMSHYPDSVVNEAMMSRAGYFLDVNLDSSYNYAVQLYDISKKLHLPIKEARALDLQAVVFTRQGNEHKALENLFKSLLIKKSVKDSSGVSFTYNAIGAIYENMEDYEKARANYQNAVAWTEKEFEYYESVGLTNIGNILLKTGQPDSALYYAFKALQFNADATEAWLLIGKGYQQKNKAQLAMKYFKKAATPRAPIAVAIEAYKNISEIFKKANRKDSAFFYARKGFALARTVKDPYKMVSTGNTLASLFSDDHQYDSAFYYQHIVLMAKDSLFTEEKEKQIHNIYFNETLRQQELEAQKERYRSKLKIYMAGGLLILLVLLGLGYRARLRSKFYKQLSQIEMRALRAQMNPHFIFNCLASINRYIVRSDTKTASAYLTKFSKLIRLILDNSSGEWVALDAEMQMLKLYLDMESLRFDHAFEYEIEQDELIASDTIIIPTMIIQPYIENAIWHGLLHKEPKGKLWIRFIKRGDAILQVEIEDNGIGRKKAQELRSKDTIKTKSYGMQISKDRIQIINAQYNIHSSVAIEDLYDADGMAAGTKVTVTLPLVHPAANPYLIKTTV